MPAKARAWLVMFYGYTSASLATVTRAYLYLMNNLSYEKGKNK